jgi:hypothetical protein
MAAPGLSLEVYVNSELDQRPWQKPADALRHAPTLFAAVALYAVVMVKIELALKRL